MRSAAQWMLGAGLVLVLLASACSSDATNSEVEQALHVEVANPVPGLPTDPQHALATTVANAHAGILLPTAFATDANQLIWANYGPPSNGNDGSSRHVEIMFKSRGTISVDGVVAPSSFLLHEFSNQLVSPPGVKIKDDAAGFILFEKTVSKSREGDPIRTIYTAFRGTTALVMTFAGEQPTLDRLTTMLGTLRTLTP